MFKFKITLTDGKIKFLKSNDKQKILDYIKDNLLNIRGMDMIEEDDKDYINFLSEEDQIEMLDRYPEYIEYIKKPSEKIQMFIAKKYYMFLNYIKKPIKKALLIAASLDGDNILRTSDNPNEFPEEIKLTAIKENGEAIRFLDNPSEEIQLAAITQNPYSKRFIKHPTEKVKQLYKQLTSKK